MKKIWGTKLRKEEREVRRLVGWKAKGLGSREIEKIRRRPW